MTTYTWSLNQVGTLTISNGVYSGFSETDYLQGPFPQSTITKFECEFIFTTSSDISTWQAITGQYNSSYNWKTPQFEIEDGYVNVLMSSDGNSWDGYLRSGNISANTNYSLYVLWEGSTITATLTDLDNSTNIPFSVYSGTGSISSLNWSVALNVGYDAGFTSYMRGSIDMAHSYMKVNDQYFLCSEDVPPQQNVLPYVGGDQCEAIYLGDTLIRRVYLGDIQIYDIPE